VSATAHDELPPDLALEVLAWGWGSVRDRGRSGLAHLGRPRAGAVDLPSLGLANRLVGNRPDAAGIETGGGTTLVARRALLVAVAGAQVEARVEGGPPLGWGVPVALPGGAVVHLGRVSGGVRTYLAVRGGLAATGSADAWGLHADAVHEPTTHPAAPRPWTREIGLWPGPRLGWFAPGTWERLLAEVFVVSGVGDRVGVRLDGPPLVRAHHGELASEGMVEGSVQVPPDGRPIVMLADHPTTGGYPVIAVVDPLDLPAVAQAPPGTSLRFRAASRPRR
jgi:allophanate hydrolase subunit 2